MSEGGVRQRFIRFKNGRTNVHDEEKSEHCELVANANEKISENNGAVALFPTNFTNFVV